MRTRTHKRERERNATRINYREHINSYRMDDVCVQHEFHFLCIVERILTRIPVERRMNTTRTERGPDFVPVVVHVPDHGRLTCVLSSTYARENEANSLQFLRQFDSALCLLCSRCETRRDDNASNSSFDSLSM